MKLTQVNENTYASPHRKTFKMEVEFCLDMVPGAFDTPEDLMRWIAQNPYVKKVTFDTRSMLK